MNEVLEEPITEAREEITDVAEHVEFIDAPQETQLVEEAALAQNEVIPAEVDDQACAGRGRGHHE